MLFTPLKQTFVADRTPNYRLCNFVHDRNLQDRKRTLLQTTRPDAFFSVQQRRTSAVGTVLYRN